MGSTPYTIVNKMIRQLVEKLNFAKLNQIRDLVKHLTSGMVLRNRGILKITR